MAIDIVLKEMILNAPEQVASFEESLSNINSQISELTKVQTSLTRICNTVITDFETYLLDTKFPGEDYYMYKGENYNQFLSITGSFTDWIIYKIRDLENLTYIGEDTFSCDGDQTDIFTEGIQVSVIDESDTRVYGTVKESSFGGAVTEITLNESVLTGSLSSVWSHEYSYVNGDDSTIDNDKTNWDFSHNYLVQPLGTSGTYGILANISQMNIAKDLLTSNKTKINSSISIFQEFLNI